MPNLLVHVPRQATASYMPAPVGVTCSWISGQPLLMHLLAFHLFKQGVASLVDPLVFQKVPGSSPEAQHS